MITSEPSPRSILIVGGGLVGASLAIALDAAGIPATLVESAPPRAEAQPSYDERNLALARASVNALRRLGVWQHTGSSGTAIEHIHVSRAGEFGSVRLHARDEGFDALGWTLPARELGRALLRRLDQCTQLGRLAPATLQGLQAHAGGWRAQVECDGKVVTVDTPLLVGADGSDSFVRDQLGIEADTYDYRQSLFVCTVTPERAHAGRAYERFADEGPTALLPLAEGRCGLVLTVPTTEAQAVAALDDEGYLQLAQQRFGWRLGHLRRPGRRFAYPIRRVAASRLVGPRAVLVGNAAQTIHPIGAQGFNLGLRDALTLAEKVAGVVDPGEPALLADYAARRAADREGTMAMSHGLVRLACLSQPLLGPLRSLALLAADRVSPLRHAVARRGMGFGGEPPQSALEPVP